MDTGITAREVYSCSADLSRSLWPEALKGAGCHLYLPAGIPQVLAEESKCMVLGLLWHENAFATVTTGCGFCMHGTG